MVIPLRTDVPLRRTPWMNWAIIALNVLVFLALYTNESGTAHGPLSRLILNGMPLKTALSLDPTHPAIWQFITYQFLHEGWLHIGANMLFLFIFGNNVNDRLGQWGYLAFYLAGGVMAGLGHCLTDTAMVLGASGAVAAVTGAYLILLPRSNITLFFFFIFIGPMEIPGLWFVLLSFSEDVLSEIFPNVFGGGAVAHMAHISGALFGAVICLLLLAVNLLPRDPNDIFTQLVRWNRRRAYRSMVSKGYNPFGYTPQNRPDVRPDPPSPQAAKLLDLRAEISEAIAHHNLPHAAYLYLELKKLDNAQVLARQAQLNVANQLASQQFYPQAADAYELFLSHFPNFEQIEQVELMLGVIYARYLRQYERARQLLLRALARLHTEREIQWARDELASIEAQAKATQTDAAGG